MYGDMELGPSSPIAAQPQRQLWGGMPQQQMQQPKRGGFMSGLSDFFLGTPGQTQQFQNFTPQQQMALSQLLSQGMGGLDTGVLETQSRQGFAQQTVPSIAERFSGMGSGGGQRSSAFAGALGSAGAGLETSLAGLRQGSLMQMLNMGMTPQFETMYNPASQGFFGSLLPALMQGAGQASGLAAMSKFGKA